MKKDYVVKIKIFDNTKYTIDLYSKAEFKNEPKYLEDSEENKDIYYEYFDTEEDAEKYIQECKNKVFFNIKERYFDNGDCSIHFSTVQLPKKQKIFL